MALEFSTIGVSVNYCVETSAGTRPTSGYTKIPDIKSIPDIAMTPSNLQVTNLDDDVHRYIPGVADAGSDIALTGNMTASLKTAWASLVSAAETAWSSGKATWFEVKIPSFDSFYFAGLPSKLGVNAMSVDAVIETSLHIIPNQIAGWAAASTT